MKIPVQNVYYLLLYAWNHLGEGEESLVSESGFTRLQDLLAHVLAETVARLLARGLDRNYVVVDEAVGGIRGKVDVATTVKRNLLVSARTHCEFDELQYDVLHNRIIKSTLRSLLSLDIDPGIRSHVRRLHRKLDPVADVAISRRDFRRVQLHRNNRVYDFALRICELIHENLMIEPGEGAAKFRDFRGDERLMARVFEDFVLNFFRREQSEFRVSRPHIQWHDAWGSPLDLQVLPVMRTDVVLEGAERRIILDTKYYVEALKGRFEQKKLASGHLYQIFAYVENRAASTGNSPPHEGMLLYPVVDESFSFRFTLKGHPVSALTVNLNQPWPRLREDMLALLA